MGSDDGRRRRLTLAPGGLPAWSAPPELSSSPTSGSRFSVLVEDGSESADESCSSEVPVGAVLEVIDSPPAAEWSTMVRRGRRSDEELAQDFWNEIGFPTPASRFWETRSPRSAGTSSDAVSGCRSPVARDGSPAQQWTAGKVGVGSKSSASQGYAVARRPRASSWRGPLPSRRVTPPPVLGQFLERAAVLPSTAAKATVNLELEARSTSISNLHAGGPQRQQFSWAGLGQRMRCIWEPSLRLASSTTPDHAASTASSTSPDHAASTAFSTPLTPRRHQHLPRLRLRPLQPCLRSRPLLRHLVVKFRRRATGGGRFGASPLRRLRRRGRI